MQIKWSEFSLAWLPVSRLIGVSSQAAPGKYCNDELTQRVRASTEDAPIEVVFRDDQYYIISGQVKATMYVNAAADPDATLLCKVYQWDAADDDSYTGFVL